MADAGWRIAQSCPQCGGEVTLGEADRLLACDYCRVRLFVATEGPARYFLAPRDPSPDDLWLVPYWRVRGPMFHCRRKEVTGTVADVTRLAAPVAGLPASLGIRPQAVPLRHLTPETPGRRLRVAEPALGAIPAEIDLEDDHRVLVGEVASLIYFPVRVRGGIVDALVDREISRAESNGLKALLDSAPSASAVRFHSTLCPACGWDLDGERESLVLFCRNCDSAWEGEASGLHRRTLARFRTAADAPVQLPFWVSTIEGRNEWVPAFKIHPHHYIRLARALTILDPETAPEQAIMPGPIQAVTVPTHEIVDARTVLASAMYAPPPNPEPSQIRLVLVSFRASCGDLILPGTQIAVRESLLGNARNI